MSEHLRSSAPAAVGRAVALGIVVLLVGAFLVTRGGDDPADRTVVAYFTDASPLAVGGLVKSSGVKVGEITDIRLENDRAAVELVLDEVVLPLGEDARATIKAKSLLGERYVDIDRGRPGAPMSLPGEIPVDRTSQSTALQDVLDTVDDPTSTALAALVTTLGEGTAGQGAQVKAALAKLAPALGDLERLGRVLDEQNAVLTSVIDRVTPVAAAAAGNEGRELDRVVDASDAALAAVARERVALSEAVRRLPEALRTFRATVQEVSRLGDDASVTLRSLRPVTEQLPEISSELRTFADAADPALASLPVVLRRAEQLIDQATPLVEGLEPGVAALPSVSDTARRLVREIQPDLKVILDFAKGWALSTNGEDGLGNYFRGVAAYTPQALLQAPGIPIPGAPTTQSTAPVPGAPVPGDLLGGVDGVLGGTVSGLTESLTGGLGLTGGTQSPSGKDPNSATGLNSEQEQNLLGMLLGGAS